jgi:hypothetical protein
MHSPNLSVPASPSHSQTFFQRPNSDIKGCMHSAYASNQQSICCRSVHVKTKRITLKMSQITTDMVTQWLNGQGVSIYSAYARPMLTHQRCLLSSDKRDLIVVIVINRVIQILRLCLNSLIQLLSQSIWVY